MPVTRSDKNLSFTIFNQIICFKQFLKRERQARNNFGENKLYKKYMRA